MSGRVDFLYFPEKIQREFHSKYEKQSHLGVTLEAENRFGCYFFCKKKTALRVRAVNKVVFPPRVYT